MLYGVGIAAFMFRIDCRDMVNERKSDFELLEHVIKGVHIEGQGPRNHRMVPRLLDHVDDGATTVKRRPAAKPERGSRPR